MHTTTLSLLTAALIALPLAAQDPPRPPAMPRPPVPAATRGDTLKFTPLSEAQHDQLDAIRTRYAKEARVEREATRVRREKMREEIRNVLTPAQREQMAQRRGMMQDGGMMEGRGAMRGPGGMQGRGAMQGHGRMTPEMGRNRPAMPPMRGRDRPGS